MKEDFLHPNDLGHQVGQQSVRLRGAAAPHPLFCPPCHDRRPRLAAGVLHLPHRPTPLQSIPPLNPTPIARPAVRSCSHSSLAPVSLKHLRASIPPAGLTQVMADIVIHLLQEATLGLALWPLGFEDEAAALGRLPEPMYPGEATVTGAESTFESQPCPTSDWRLPRRLASVEVWQRRGEGSA
jgi:hypothetical protein